MRRVTLIFAVGALAGLVVAALAAGAFAADPPEIAITIEKNRFSPRKSG